MISNAGEETQHYVLELDGKDLSLVGGTTGENKEAKGIEAVNGTVTIKKAGDVLIEATAENGKAHAIYASGAGNDVVIERDDDNKDAKITMVAKDNDKSAAVLHADKGANVKIDGIVDITQTNGKEAIAVGEGSKVEIAGGVIGGNAEEGKDNVAIKVTEGGKIKINEAGEDHDVVIKGKIILGAAKPVEENQEEQPVMFKSARRIVVPEDKSSVTLTTQGSKLEDDVHYDNNGDNDFYAIFTNGASWTGNSTGGVDLKVLLADGGAWTGYHEDEIDNNTLTMEINSGAIWTNTATNATSIASLSGEGGYIQMSENENAGLTIEDYSGKTTFFYTSGGDNDIIGGDVTINKASEGSIVNMRTNAAYKSMDKAEIAKVLNALAAKLIAGTEAVNYLKGEVQIAEGITSSETRADGDIVFTDGKGTVDESSINYGAYIDPAKYETAMMKGAKSAMTASAMMWRAEANDLMKRMGDLRMAEGEQGIWAKYYGTKQEMEAQNTKYTNNYKAYQLGYDKKVGDWTVGVAASYGDGESTYASGRGENSVVSLGLYGAWNSKDGQYVDVIMKRSKLDNEYALNSGDASIGKIEADYETWATSISAEYGKRFETNKGFYVEPSAELTLGRVEGENYNTSLSVGGERLNVQQDDYDSLIGRLGLRLGQKLDKASYYAKLAVAKEFCGDYDTKYATVDKSGSLGQYKETSMSFGDTWYELQIGGTAQLSDNSYFYASYERNFGADVEQKWRVDAGLRFSF